MGFEVLKDLTEEVSKGFVYLVTITAFIGLVLFSIVNLVKDNFEPIYFFIGTAITLSGFTMLSGIFSKDKKTKIEKNLFLYSIMFLFSAFSFILFIGFYVITKDIKVPTTWQQQILIDLVVITYYAGIIPFLFGFAFLIITLIRHYKQVGQNMGHEGRSD